MKPWVLALGGSLALHLAVAAAFRSEELASEPRPVAKRGDGFVSFTTVSVAAPPRAVAAAPARALKVNVAVPSLAVAVEALTDSPVAIEGGAPAQEANPEPGVGSPAAPGPGVEQPSAGSRPVDPSAEVIALVHARLAAAADRCYPAAARRFRQRGTVQLSFCTDARGGTASTSVTQSSGAELLDAAARGCVLENAAPFPVEASTRCFSVPVRFGQGP